jgi:HK97 family phage major capsid protein
MSGNATDVPTRERRDELIEKAREIAEKAKGEKRHLTADEQTEIGEHLTEVKTINEALVAEAKSKELMGQLDAMAITVPDTYQKGGDGANAPQLSLGEHFVKHAHGAMVDAKGQQGKTFVAPDWGAKANTDPFVVGGWTAGAPFLTEFDRTIIRALRIRLTVADLLSQGTISGNAISYLVEGAMEGAFTTVDEGAAKPQIHFVNPTQVTDALKKIAGFIKLTDEFIDDADFLVTEINNRLLYQLGYFEEQQLLNGNGTGTNLLGLLNRSGIQTEVSASFATNPHDWPDAIFRAMTKVNVNSGFPPDGLIIHPLDYQTFRLQRDNNQQYYGGGFFQAAYGEAGVPLVMQPPLWGLKTVVTPAIAQGTILTGAFQSVSTVYRKGGVRVEAATQHASDFTSNLVTVRAEERVALAVRVPLGLCKVTLTA